MEKAYKSFPDWIYLEKQSLGSLFCQELIQMSIDLYFTTDQVL